MDTYNNSNNLKSMLVYIKENFGLEVFTKPGRISALLSDLAPGLQIDRAMVDTISRVGIFEDFATNSNENVQFQKSSVSKAMRQLTEDEFIVPEIASLYIGILIEVFEWNIELESFQKTMLEQINLDGKFTPEISSNSNNVVENGEYKDLADVEKDISKLKDIIENIDRFLQGNWDLSRDQAHQLCNRLQNHLEKRYRTTGSEEDCQKLISVLMDGAKISDIEDNSSAMMYEKARTFAEEAYYRFSNEKYIEIKASCYEEEILCMYMTHFINNQEDNKKATELGKNAIKLREEFYSKEKTMENQVKLAKCYRNVQDMIMLTTEEGISLGEKRARIETPMYCTMSLEQFEEYCKPEQKADLGDLAKKQLKASSDLYASQAQRYEAASKFTDAKKWYEDAISFKEELCKLYPDVKTILELSDLYMSLANICSKIGNYNEARDWFDKSYYKRVDYRQLSR